MMLFQSIYSRLSSANVEAKEESLFWGASAPCGMHNLKMQRKYIIDKVLTVASARTL